MEHILKFLLSPWAWAIGFLWPLATQTLIAAELMASGTHGCWRSHCLGTRAYRALQGSWIWIK